VSSFEVRASVDLRILSIFAAHPEVDLEGVLSAVPFWVAKSQVQVAAWFSTGISNRMGERVNEGGGVGNGKKQIWREWRCKAGMVGLLLSSTWMVNGC
jgi:hypothetical protein